MNVLPPEPIAPAIAAPTPANIANLLSEIDAVVEDALKGGPSLQADIATLVLGGAGVAVELGWITSQTDSIIAAVATVVLASVFRIITLVRHGQKAKVKAAAYQAAGLAVVNR